MKRYLYLISIGLLLMASCKKEQQEIYNIIPNSTSSATISLSIDKIINDSTISLKWSKTPQKNFKQYQLTRSARVFKNGAFVGIYDQLKNFTSVDSLTYLDKGVPFASDIQYSITALTDSFKIIAGTTLTYQRPNTYLKAKFSDVLVDRQQKIAYLINMDNGTVSAFNYATNQLIKTGSINTRIGYSSLGSYGGGINNELYLPTNDGWLFILDAASLTVKDKIFVEGDVIGSVVAAGDKLFVSSSDQSFGLFYNNSLKIYDRKTKMVTGRTGVWNNTRVVLLENTNYELVDLTFNIIPIDLNYYKVDAAGIPVSQKSDPYHGDHQLDPANVKSFPDGNHIITGSQGTIYNKNLIYEKALAANGNFGDFEFNAAGSLIYCAVITDKKISVIAYPSGTLQQTITTKLFPVKMFRDGNQLIVLSTERSYDSNPVFFIEKFNL